ncbi:MAG: hypothetical protein ACRDKE_10030, partial [Solirubrobacterales bacterium]
MDSSEASDLVGARAIAVAPYLHVHERANIGAWELIPFGIVADNLTADEFAPGCRDGVLRLVEAYAIDGLIGSTGVLAKPAKALIGDGYRRDEFGSVSKALFAGAVADNPLLSKADGESSNSGYSMQVSENALFFGQPFADGNSYAVESGAWVSTTSLRHADAEEPLPKMEPPRELPPSLFSTFDLEVAEATWGALNDAEPTLQLGGFLDWMRVVFSNSTSISAGLRIGAARAAIEALLDIDMN